MDSDVTLRYDGAADLVFHDATGRRKVTRGQTFTTDARTAALLVATDPAVTQVPEAADPAADETDDDLSRLKVPQLRELLANRGLETSGTKAELLARLDAAQEPTSTAQEAASEEPTGTAAEAASDEPGAATEGAPDGQPASETPPGDPPAAAGGAISVGDLLAGGKVQGG
jgi:hypothetical protein